MVHFVKIYNISVCRTVSYNISSLSFFNCKKTCANALMCCFYMFGISKSDFVVNCEKSPALRDQSINQARILHLYITQVGYQIERVPYRIRLLLILRTTLAYSQKLRPYFHARLLKISFQVWKITVSITFLGNLPNGVPKFQYVFYVSAHTSVRMLHQCLSISTGIIIAGRPQGHTHTSPHPDYRGLVDASEAQITLPKWDK